MKINHIKILCLIVAFILIVFSACGCKKTKNDNPGSQIDSAVSSESQTSVKQESQENQNDEVDDETYEEFYPEDYTPNDDDYESSDNALTNTESESESEQEDYRYLVDDVISVYNSKAPIMTNYRGSSGTIWHAFGFMKNDITGRKYTDEMMNLELSRLYDSGVRYCRTRFDSAWVWDAKLEKWNWNSERMGYFYEYAKALEKQQTSILLNLGWDFPFIINGTSSTYEVKYLNGRDEADVYGESADYDMSGLSDNYKVYARAALRYGEWGAQLLKALKQNGVNNVSHFLYFTEPSYGWDDNPTGNYAEEYLFVCKIIKEKIIESGFGNTIKHMGPNQGQIKTGDGLLRYVLEREPDLFDVYAVHEYFDEAGDITNDVFYDLSYPVFSSYMDVMKQTGALDMKKEFWVDETDVSISTESGVLAETAWCGMQAAVTAITAQQCGIQNIINWQFADQLWTDSTVTNSQFQNGIHISGAAPSLFVSTIPYEHYYTYNLLRKYNGYQNGTVYQTSNGMNFGIYTGAVLLEDGSWTITIVNTNITDTSFVIEFDEAIDATLYRHMQMAAKTKPTSDARLADVDKVYENVGTQLYDVLPGGSIAVYTGLKY